MRTVKVIVLTVVASTGLWVAGCGAIPFFDWGTDTSSDYLGIAVAEFGDTNTIPIQRDVLGTESTAVSLPEDLLESVPEETAMSVRGSDVEVSVDEVDDVISPAAVSSERHAVVMFGIALAETDACASEIRIGPFGLTIVDGEVKVTNESVTLTAEAREVVRAGNFEMCAQTLADFDGVLSLKKFSIEFGRLKTSEESVELCHIPPGNPDNRHTITVGVPAVDAHLAHGDYQGECRDVIEDLDLSSVCANEPDEQRRWRVRNPNDFDVGFNWEVYQSDKSGTLTAPEGDSYFFTDTRGGENTVIMTWRNASGEEQSDISASTGAQCPPDADDDGVTDDSDLCPDTPVDETADADGCSCSQRDTDVDGVDDCDDACPDTTDGTTVDETGCEAVELDEDGDGVSDAGDDCPNTPAGEEANASGCSCSQRDSDADGVNDCTDLCANTALGEEVGSNGCPINELDGDDDGVPDESDSCLNTPAGETVDSDGCSCTQLDEDADGVSNCDDLCPGTPVGVAVDVNGCEVTLADAGEDVTLDEVGCVTLHGSASGGTPPYIYSWSASGWEGSMEQDPTVVPSETTVYTLTVTDWSVPPEVVTDTVTITINAHDDLQFSAVNLGSLSSNPSYPSALNDAGQVVGYYYSDTWEKRAFLYNAGALTDLGTLGGTEAYARDINNLSQVVGQSNDADGNIRAFRWDAGNGMRDLGTLGGDTAIAYGINDDAQIVGQAQTDSATHAFIYANDTMSDLGTTEYFQSGAFEVSDSGMAVGTYLAWGYDQQAFISDNGTFIDLGSPLLSGSRAVAINGEGLVTGFSWGLGEYKSFLYACGTTIDLGAIDGFPKTYAWDMNDSGQIVGYASTSDGTLSHAFLYTGGNLYDLNDLLETEHSWEYLTVAFAINNVGQIAGYGRIDGQYRAFVLTPGS
ncbi:MAG: hypothetical protein JSU63_20935 [Phycisphaerales bacterium]|nr:MAG: hypothetical protein JSU63_20935 [Phycisphaerales bacterium]